MKSYTKSYFSGESHSGETGVISKGESHSGETGVISKGESHSGETGVRVTKLNKFLI
jgi:hypothetical protein